MMAAADNALVLEGGGFRGMFTAGVLDVLQEQGIYDFGSVWGVSAGALAAVSYKSHQIGRTMRVMLAFRDDRRFMSLWSLATTGNLAGVDFMYDQVQNYLDPGDDAAFNAEPMQMIAVATSVTFGTAVYQHVAHMPEDVRMIAASASMPLVSRIVDVNGLRLLDGGTADSIPVDAALGLVDVDADGVTPAKRALVVLTQDATYRKSGANERAAALSPRYAEFPYYVQALRSRAGRYNACRAHVRELEAEGRVLCLLPPEPVDVGTSGASGEKLLTLYLQGRTAATERLADIQAFLAQ